jgi:hypothetical protein
VNAKTVRLEVSNTTIALIGALAAQGPRNPMRGEPVIMQVASTGSMAARVSPIDWSEQEMRELGRIERVLQLAGLTTEIVYGLTDEGDPWCVIYRTESNNVLAHFARIDRTCMGSWNGLGGIQSGAGLRDLSDHFLRWWSKHNVLDPTSALAACNLRRS